MITSARVVVFTFVAALAVFCAVQDRLTAAGAREYVDRQRAAIAGSAAFVTVDDVMQPAIRHAVRVALAWSAVVTGAGLSGAAIVARRSRRE
jgi:hypothetical protein